MRKNQRFLDLSNKDTPRQLIFHGINYQYFFFNNFGYGVSLQILKFVNLKNYKQFI